MALDPTLQSSPATLPPGVRVGAVVSVYHHELTAAMAESARRTLVGAGLAEQDFELVTAPGAFELPVIAQRLARRPDVDAVLCFGLVLKGETRHDEYVAGAASEGLVRVALDEGKPCLFGVLTCATIEQARARALPVEQGGQLDKGREVARAAIHALASLHAIDEAAEEDQ